MCCHHRRTADSLLLTVALASNTSGNVAMLSPRRQRKIEKRMYKNMRRAERYARKQERREAIFSLIVGLFTGDNKPPQKAQMVERVQSAEGSLGTMAQQPRRLQAPVVASEKTLNPANATSITSTSTSACDSNNAAVIQPKLPSYNEAIST